MTLLDTAACRLDPRPQRWTYDLATLTGAGVHVDDEQAGLLDPDTAVREVIVPYALADPLHNYPGAFFHEWELPRMWVHGPYGPKGTVVIPTIGLIDWQLEGSDPSGWFGSEQWWRFPSVPVRVIVPDGGDEASQICRCLRVWNVWPLYGSHNDEDTTAWSIMDVSEAAYLTGWYAQARSYADYVHGRVTACDLVDITAGEDDVVEHRHTDVGDCLTGQVYLGELERSLFRDGNVGWWAEPYLGLQFTDGAAHEAWSRLVASSKRNSTACLGVVPDWEAPTLAESERRFCPWALC